MEKLWLSKAMKEYKKTLKYGVLNLINSPAGSGKTTFVFDDLIKNYERYGIKKLSKNKMIYVCDTSSLEYRILMTKKDIVKKYEHGDLDKNEDKILVMTYAKLGNLLKDFKTKVKLFDSHLFIFDEVHNLVRYSSRYDVENKKVYSVVINAIKELLKYKIMCIGMSATIEDNMTYVFNKNEITCNRIFLEHQVSKLKSYNFEPRKINYVFNILKEFVLRDDLQGKLLIYTNTITQAERYKQFLIKNGMNAEWLCSIRAKEEDENGKKVLRMNDEQLKIRKILLDTGKIPEDLNLDVIIINAAYETGIDIYNDNIKYVIVDDKNESTQIQARNRVRNNIDELYVTSNYIEHPFYEGVYVDPILNQYKEVIDYGEEIYVPNLAKYLDTKFTGIKLNDELKKEMVELYSTKKCYKENNIYTFISLKEDIEKLRYKVCVTNSGTYILTHDELTEYLLSNDKKYSDEVAEEYIKFLNKEDDKMSGNNKSEIKEYLSRNIGRIYVKEEKEELINVIGLRDNEGVLQDKPSMLKLYLEDNFGLVLNSKAKTNRNGKSVKGWKIVE
ncbi:DEAD/DEAH box helicase family protein [Paraclostridium tenue]